MSNQTSSVLKEEDWSEDMTCPDPGEPKLLGFLQLCADRRFHQCIQKKFQSDAKLNSPDAYWIHADAGGTPKMECQRTAPDYCYYTKKVKLMGWSAHGNVCGGFGPDVPDDVIRKALIVVAQRKVDEYPEADHFIYFATVGKGKDAVCYSMKCEKRTSGS
jgi:hypothetical protein